MARKQESFDALLLQVAKDDPNLTEIVLIGQDLTKEDIQKLATALENNTHVSKIDLSMNLIDDAGTKLLAKALLNKQNIKSLFLKFAKIGPNACKDLALLLPTLTNLQEFMLDGNPVKNIGSAEIIKAVTTHPSIQEFGLQYTSVGDQLAEQCCAILDNNKVIKRLLLGGNNFTSKGMRALAQHLQNSTNLELLNLWNNCRGNFFDPIMYDVEKFYTDPVVTSSPQPPSIDLFKRVQMFFGFNPVVPKSKPQPAPVIHTVTNPAETVPARPKLHIMC